MKRAPYQYDIKDDCFIIPAKQLAEALKLLSSLNASVEKCKQANVKRKSSGKKPHIAWFINPFGGREWRVTMPDGTMLPIYLGADECDDAGGDVQALGVELHRITNLDA